MMPSPAVSGALAAIKPMLVTSETLLRNGPTLDDLRRLLSDLDDFGAGLVAAAERDAADLPAPLVDALVNAVGAVAAAL